MISIYRLTSIGLAAAPYKAELYDIPFLLAHGISQMVSNGADYRNGTLLHQYLLQTEFIGASGDVFFDENGDRSGYTKHFFSHISQHRLGACTIANSRVFTHLWHLRINELAKQPRICTHGCMEC
jgi:hypothetical protein